MEGEEETGRCDDYVLQEILSRLPAKSLGKSLCTSRRWQDLISSPFLMKLQAERSINNVLGLLNVTTNQQGGCLAYIALENIDAFEAPNTNLGFNGNRISVKASGNGLLFLCLPGPNIYMLGNPTTKSFRQICGPPTNFDDTRFGIAFDPATSLAIPRLVGCTPVPRTSNKEAILRFKIFSPETNTWRRVSESTTYNQTWKLFDSVCSVFFNGALHWLREDGDIIAFDVAEERHRVIELPESVQARSVAGYTSVWFGVVGGKLTLVKFSKGIHVWEMERYDTGRWEYKKSVKTREYSFRCYRLRKHVPLFYDGEKFVLLTWSRELEEHRECGLAVYRIRTGRWDKIRKLQGWMDSRRHFFPHIGHMVRVI